MPLTASCDDLDPTLCFLPWPSNTFARVDESTATGLRLALDSDELAGDDPGFLNLADGFSRLSSVVVGFRVHLDDGFLDGATPGRVLSEPPIQVFEAQPGLESWGTEIPLWFEVVPGGSDIDPVYLLIGHPLVPMRANADHVVVVHDTLQAV